MYFVFFEQDFKFIFSQNSIAFGNIWTNPENLGSIMLPICKEIQKNSWPNVLNDAMRIILKQFEYEPVVWSYHLLEFGKSEDVRRGVNSYENYISGRNDIDKKMITFIRRLLSKIDQWQGK